MRALAVIAALALAACAAPQLNPKSMSESELLDACAGECTLQIVQELLARGVIKPEHADDIRRGVVQTDMDLNEIWAVWGYPIERHTTDLGITYETQYVYRGFRFAYARNGRVVAVQD